jgi:hypothetical protein
MSATGTGGAAGGASNVLYQADFTDRTSGWPDELAFQNYYVGYHEPDNYHVEVHAQNDNAVVVAPGQTFDNFSAESQENISKANTAQTGDFRYGLVVRRSGNRYYAFTLSPRSKTWYALKSSSTGLQVLATGKSDDVKSPDAFDTLRVNAKGPLMTFYLNGKALGQINDADYAKGELGFYVETFDTPRVHVHFHSLVVTPAADVAPMAAAPSAGAPAGSGTTVVCRVTPPLLNLRSGPGVAYQPPLLALYAGTQLQAVGRTADGTWLKVRVSGSNQEGWVAAQVTCNAPISGLPVSVAPPPPPAPPAPPAPTAKP